MQPENIKFIRFYRDFKSCNTLINIDEIKLIQYRNSIDDPCFFDKNILDGNKENKILYKIKVVYKNNEEELFHLWGEENIDFFFEQLEELCLEE